MTDDELDEAELARWEPDVIVKGSVPVGAIWLFALAGVLYLVALVGMLIR